MAEFSAYASQQAEEALAKTLPWRIQIRAIDSLGEVVQTWDPGLVITTLSDTVTVTITPLKEEETCPELSQ